MSSEKPKWWKTPPYSNVVGGLILAAILGLLRLGYEWITAPIALTTIKGFWNLLTSSFSYVLNYEFKFWWLLCFLLIGSIIRYIIRIRNRPIKLIINGKDSEDISKMLSYTADKIDGLIWKWEWKFNYIINRYEVKGAIPLCNNMKCKNAELVPDGYNDEFGAYLYNCYSCHNNYGSQEEPSYVENMIENKYSNLQSQHHQPQS
jgi:hypothetical protein